MIVATTAMCLRASAPLESASFRASSGIVYASFHNVRSTGAGEDGAMSGERLR